MRFFQFTLTLFSFFSLGVQASPLHLELTQGVNKTIPIAVMPFQNQTSDVPGNTTLSQVISNDLQTSGEFAIKSVGEDSQASPVSAEAAQQWQKAGVNDVVIGQVHQTGPSQYAVSFQLIDTISGNAEAPGIPLLKQSFTTNQAGLRKLAHHISDLIYEKLTGTPGIFSTKIAYVLAQRAVGKASQYQLIIADQDGFNPQTLLRSEQPIMSPTWSPDGRALAYVSFEGHHGAIYQQNLTTGGRITLSNYAGINSAPAFSPDGRKLALSLTLSGNPNLYLMDLSSRRLTQITKGYAIDTEPVWLSDGHSLLFTSDRAGGPQIYRYDLNSGAIARVTFDGSYNARARPSQDGKMLALLHGGGGGFNIAKQNLVTGQTTVLTDSGADDSPSLAPNGKMVLYGTRAGGREVLGLVSMDGRIKMRLPSAQGEVIDPSWSPFLKQG